jgi:hypothetical protein
MGFLGRSHFRVKHRKRVIRATVCPYLSPFATDTSLGSFVRLKRSSSKPIQPRPRVSVCPGLVHGNTHRFLGNGFPVLCRVSFPLPCPPSFLMTSLGRRNLGVLGFSLLALFSTSRGSHASQGLALLTAGSGARSCSGYLTTCNSGPLPSCFSPKGAPQLGHSPRVGGACEPFASPSLYKVYHIIARFAR